MLAQLIRPSDVLLLVVDVQEKLVPAIARHTALLQRVMLLMQAATATGVPTLATEHCPDKIGPLLPEITQHLTQPPLAKRSFDATQAPGTLARLRQALRPSIALVGMEAHVCVLHTALGLQAAGWQVGLVADAVGSRREEDRATALSLAAANNMAVIPAETLVFGWLGSADHPAFRPVLAGVRALSDSP
ncbi:MAG: isochorismatase family protein [Alphaproteobacteria bacterium]|nr:isochorismatase family protein [Alphaproteobacteria bacterium]